jgi:hemoglobin/transferrin/lactoferrin receptor protein
MTSISSRRSAAACALALLGLTLAHGQEHGGIGTQATPGAAPEPPSLDELVVTANRIGSDPLATPATVATSTREDLERDLTRTVPEALKSIPGVAVQKTANGQGSPIIRGFTGYRTLAMIDGIRYNHSAYRDGPNEYFALIDPQALDRLELVQGPGSVLYGSDAVGGALNLFTRSAAFMAEAEGESFHHGGLFGRWHSSEQSWQARADYDFGTGQKWGLHLGGTWKDFGDVIAAEVGEQGFTGYTQRSYDARLDARLDNHWTLTLAH